MSAPVIVFDNGTGYMKAGLSNKETPMCTIPALIGRPMLRFKQKIENIELKPIMIGDEVIPVRSLLELTYPMEEGIIKNAGDMEILWDYVLQKKLKINKSDFKNRKLLITEAPNNPDKNKEKMAQILFEKIGIGFFNIEPQAKMTLYCEGGESGVVLDSGDGVTHVIPIAKNFLLQHQIKRLDIAGRHITNYLTRLMQIKGYAFNSTADFEIVRELKEKYCFVSCDIKSDRKLDQETTYYNTYTKLPDGRKIRISCEKFEAPEILFQPNLIQNEMPGVHEMLYNCINVSKNKLIYFFNILVL
jgi:actin-related protein 2